MNLTTNMLLSEIINKIETFITPYPEYNQNIDIYKIQTIVHIAVEIYNNGSFISSINYEMSNNTEINRSIYSLQDSITGLNLFINWLKMTPEKLNETIQYYETLDENLDHDSGSSFEFSYPSEYIPIILKHICHLKETEQHAQENQVIRII